MGVLMPIILVLISSMLQFSSPCCEQKERISTLLETAIDIISKAKSVNISCIEENNTNNSCSAPVDCADLHKRGYNKSGVYTIEPNSRLTSVKRLNVYCDMTTDGGGWTVIQRRGNFGKDDDYFNEDWKTYKKGFGNIEEDFWLGNDNIFALTNQRLYSVRFDLEDNDKNTSFAQYLNFWIDDEFNNYTLHIDGYSGTAGNAMANRNQVKFSTKDRSHFLPSDTCQYGYHSGWWFPSCQQSGLNGLYNNNSTLGIRWNSWKSEPLPKAEIKIRPFIL